MRQIDNSKNVPNKHSVSVDRRTRMLEWPGTAVNLCPSPEALTLMRYRAAQYGTGQTSEDEYLDARFSSNARPISAKGCCLSFVEPANTTRANPLDVVRAVATENGWALERAGEDEDDDELVLFVRGKSTDYKAFFTWMPSLEVFHLACTFDLIIPELRQAELHQLVACINEQLWFGHFDLWPSDGTAVFRQALLLVGGVSVSAQQCEVMLGTALDICERHYPAFQLVLANGSASEAMDAIILQTNGHA